MRTRRHQQRAQAVDRAFAVAQGAGVIRRWERIPDSTPERPYWSADPRSLIVRAPTTYDLRDAELFLSGVAAALTATTDAP